MGFYFDSFIIDLAAVITVIALSIYTYFKYSFSYWESKGVPHLKPSFPYGNVKDLIQRKENFGVNIADKYKQLKKYGSPYGGFYMITRPVLLVMDPDLIKTILTKEFNKFPDRGIYSNEEIDPLSAHMFALRGQKWKTLRNKLTPTFTSGKMKMMFETLASSSDILESVLEQPSTNKEIVGIKDILSRFTIDVIGSCVFGIQCNSMKNPDDEFRLYGQKFIDSTLSNTWKTVLSFVWPSFLKAFKIRLTNAEVADFLVTLLKDNIKYREANGIHRKDFMDLFIRLKNNEDIQDDHMDDESKVANQSSSSSDGVTFNEMAAQALIFFIAGYETSSTTSSVCLFELAQNLDIQRRLRKEIRDVLKKHDGKLTYDAIMEMKYLDQVLNETLRKYPIAPNLVRVCRENYKIPDDNITIEKGTFVWISVLGMHMDPEIYPHPEKFDPERFTEEEKVKRSAYHYLPFGEGPRNCIGMRFALLQTKVAVATLIKSYEFNVCPKTRIPLEWTSSGILLFPKGDIWLQTSKAV